MCDVLTRDLPNSMEVQKFSSSECFLFFHTVELITCYHMLSRSYFSCHAHLLDMNCAVFVSLDTISLPWRTNFGILHIASDEDFSFFFSFCYLTITVKLSLKCFSTFIYICHFSDAFIYRFFLIYFFIPDIS